MKLDGFGIMVDDMVVMVRFRGHAMWLTRREI